MNCAPVVGSAIGGASGDTSRWIMSKAAKGSPKGRKGQEPPGLAGALERYRPKGPGIAKYAQLSEALLGAIEAGLWKPGDKLPAEAELAAALPYSLGTVQSAYRWLADHGMVVRVHGSGTYVAERRHSMQAPWHCRFIDEEAGGHLPVYTSVVSRGLFAERGPWSAFLGQVGGAVVRVDRRISINDEFDVYSKFFVQADRFGAFLKKPKRELEGINFKLLLSQEFGTPVTRLKQTLSVGPAPTDVATALGLRKPAVVSMIEIRAATSAGDPVYYQELYIPPNQRRLYIDDTLRR